MKKAKVMVLGLCFCGAFFAFSGCGEVSNPYNILVSNQKIQFEIGEDFGFSENMKVDLIFENEDIMTLETPDNYTFMHDPIKKTYTGLHYVVDYSAFDSSKGGSYPIFVDFKDKNPDERDIRVFYLVNVVREENAWVQMPILNNWTYGQTPTFEQLPVAQYNNESLQYSYRNKGVGDFQILPKDDLYNLLGQLNAGEYELNVSFKRNYVYESLETTLNFTVERASLPQNYEEKLENIAAKPYTGSIVFPDIYGTDAYRLDNTASWQWVDVGHYEVPIEINPNYKWKDTDAFIKYFDFEITAVQNSWLDSQFELSQTNQTFGWIKGEFSLSKLVNVPVSAYGEVVFACKLLGEDDSTYLDIALKDLGSLDPAQYCLKAYVKSSDNFSDITPIVIEFEVFAE